MLHMAINRPLKKASSQINVSYKCCPEINCSCEMKWIWNLHWKLESLCQMHPIKKVCMDSRHHNNTSRFHVVTFWCVKRCDIQCETFFAIVPVSPSHDESCSNKQVHKSPKTESWDYNFIFCIEKGPPSKFILC